MRKINYYIPLLFSFLFWGCEGQETEESTGQVTIHLLLAREYDTRTVDEDNPETEQLIKNINIFLADPSSSELTYKYIEAGFSFAGDNGVVTISAEPSALLSKDIYIIANYDDMEVLDAVTTLNDLESLTTPEVDMENNLAATDGFCMFGSTTDFDFDNSDGTSPTVTLVRTCAKIQVNLTFPDNPTLSVDNSFLMQNVAKYTYVINNSTSTLPQSDYFNFAAPDVLTNNGEEVYTNIVYVYEATQRPVITIYTHINNSTEQQEYTATLPIPRRNYFYDLLIQVYEDTESGTRALNSGGIKYESVLTIYDDKGEEIHKAAVRPEQE